MCSLMHFGPLPNTFVIWTRDREGTRPYHCIMHILLSCSYTTAYVFCIRRVPWTWSQQCLWTAPRSGVQYLSKVPEVLTHCWACYCITILTTHSSHCNKWDLETESITTNAALLLWAQTLSDNSVWLLYWVWISAGSRHRPTVHYFNHLETTNPYFPIWILHHT